LSLEQGRTYVVYVPEGMNVQGYDGTGDVQLMHYSPDSGDFAPLVVDELGNVSVAGAQGADSFSDDMAIAIDVDAVSPASEDVGAAEAEATVYSLAIGGTMYESYKTDPIKIAAIGDSITRGYLCPAGSPNAVQMEQSLLGNYYQLYAYTTNGITTSRVYNDDAIYSDIANKQIQIAQVMIGTNDIIGNETLANSRANTQGIIDKLTAAGVTLIVLNYPLAICYGDPTYDPVLEDYCAMLDGLVAGNANVVRGYATGYPDFGINANLLSGDMIHPTAAGYRYLGEKWYYALAAYL